MSSMMESRWEGRLARFCEQQLTLLEAEREEDMRVMEEALASQSPNELQRRGLMLSGLTVQSVRTGLGGKTLVELTRAGALGGVSTQKKGSRGSTPSSSLANASESLSSHSFRQGDIVKLESATLAGTKNDPMKETRDATTQSPTGVVYRLTEGSLIIAFQEALPDEYLNDALVRIVMLANESSYKRMSGAIRDLAKRSDLHDRRTVQLTFGHGFPSFHVEPKSVALAACAGSFYNANLNESQQKAVLLAMNAKDLALIHGPPGTGKTMTLVEVVQQLLKPRLQLKTNQEMPSHKRILVCGPSNMSVDNMVERLAKHNVNGMNILRLGHPARMLPSVLSHSLDVKMDGSEESQLVRDVRKDMDTLLSQLFPPKRIRGAKGAGNKSIRRAGRCGGGSGKKPSINRREAFQRIKELRQELRQREKHVVSHFLNDAQVVLCTLQGAGQSLLWDHMRTYAQEHGRSFFDIVIVDEATQALEAETWIALRHAEKVLLAGDPHQLPPTVKSSKATIAKELERTLFERILLQQKKELSQSYPLVHMLEVQYRMHKSISQWSSDAFYMGRLRPHESVALHLLEDLPTVMSGTEDDDTAIAFVHIDTAGSQLWETVGCDSSTNGVRGKDGSGEKKRRGLMIGELSKLNTGEAEIVVKHAKMLISAGVQPQDIAIITPYNAQVGLLKDMLLEEYPMIEIGSVDGFQGREKEAVIISLVRSNDTRDIGFLREHRRMNVAVTRARRHCCVIGDSDTIGVADTFYQKLFDYISEHGEVRLTYPE